MCLEGEVSPLVPASILQTHPNITIYLDTASAALLDAGTVNEKVSLVNNVNH
jgi:glucosamine-6-phosphate deaminase